MPVPRLMPQHLQDMRFDRVVHAHVIDGDDVPGELLPSGHRQQARREEPHQPVTDSLAGGLVEIDRVGDVALSLAGILEHGERCSRRA